MYPKNLFRDGGCNVPFPLQSVVLMFPSGPKVPKYQRSCWCAPTTALSKKTKIRIVYISKSGSLTRLQHFMQKLWTDMQSDWFTLDDFTHTQILLSLLESHG